MSRTCAITGKKPSTGHNVSHSNRKTKRKWLPNLITKKIYDKKLWRFVKIRIATSALRNLTKELIANADKIYKEFKLKKTKKA